MPVSIPVLLGPGRGHRFSAQGLRTSAQIALGRYEHPVGPFLRAGLADQQVFVDVGAHTGYFSRMALQVMPSGAQVIAFEPDAFCRQQLQSVAAAPRLVVRADALGDVDASGTLMSKPGSCSRLEETAPGDGGTAHAVEVRTLDALVASGEVPQPGVMKIDVEGAELAVLAGARATLADVQTLVVECHSMPLLRDVLGVVLEAGFGLVRTTEGGDRLGPPTVLARRE